MELTSTSASLVIQGLGKRYGQTWALRGITAEVPAGQTLAVLGPSGCGKSTLLKLVAGLEVPDEGALLVSDTALSSPGHAVSPEHRDVSMVFQDYALWPHMRVDQIIGYGLKHGRNRTTAAARKERVHELMELLHLNGLGGKRPAELSGGQQQRVSIARALATRPSLLLFDEPLSNLDARLRDEMREELAVLLGQLGTTALYVTHDVNEALALADRILVLESGRTVQLDTPQEVLSRPVNGWAARLAGFSCRLRLRTLLPAPGTEGEEMLQGTLADGERPGSLYGRYCGDDPTDDAFAYVHPAGVQLSPGADADLLGTVSSAVFEGRHYRTKVHIGGAGTLTLFTRDDCRLGATVGLTVEPDSVLFFGSTKLSPASPGTQPGRVRAQMM